MIGQNMTVCCKSRVIVYCGTTSRKVTRRLAARLAARKVVTRVGKMSCTKGRDRRKEQRRVWHCALASGRRKKRQHSCVGWSYKVERATL
jgi:hypothetical protein